MFMRFARLRDVIGLLFQSEFPDPMKSWLRQWGLERPPNRRNWLEIDLNAGEVSLRPSGHGWTYSLCFLDSWLLHTMPVWLFLPPPTPPTTPTSHTSHSLATHASLKLVHTRKLASKFLKYGNMAVSGLQPHSYIAKC